MKKIYQTPALLEVVLTANTKLLAGSDVGIGEDYGGTGVLVPRGEFEFSDE
mgnify:CR=1 FL=1